MNISKEKNAIRIIKANKGIIKANEAIKKHIHPRTLYNLRDKGVLEQMSYGLYKLKQNKVSHPDFVAVALRVPNGVVCLISALAFHNLTTQIPHKIWVAIKRNAYKPRIDYPPISIHQFSAQSFSSGIGKHIFDKIPVKIYNPEKTIVDCFKFRNKIGMNIVLEALAFYKERKKFNPTKLMKYAKICRIENIMKPYIESII
ncbi:MAG: transcriptional regulator [Oligoflexia bacterium]|nr:transcriptional regulator [Oligoflexia bacterium]